MRTLGGLLKPTVCAFVYDVIYDPILEVSVIRTE